MHVCQRWRQLIFTSPCRLNLQLLCTRKTPARKKLDCWPQIPIAIIVQGLGDLTPAQKKNLLTAFEHSDRVCSVTLSLTIRQLEKMTQMMRRPFPALTHLRVSFTPPFVGLFIYLPSGFLGGPISGLRELDVNHISPLTLPSIRSSTSDLVEFHLRDLLMDPLVYPEAMVAGLAVMTKLKTLTIDFDYYHAPHDSDPLALNFRARVILPTLTQFQFRGSRLYLEDFVAQLDTPWLFDLTVILVARTTSDDPGVQEFPQLLQFIDRAKDLKLAQFSRARAEIHVAHSIIHFDNPQTRQHPARLNLGEVRYHGSRPLGAFLSQAYAILSSVRNLSITPLHDRIIQNKYWHRTGLLRLLHPFDTVETLHVEGQFTDLFPPMLNSLSNELVAEVLPSLRLLNFEGKPLKSVQKLLVPFIEKRRFVGRPPLTIVRTREDFERLQTLSETEGGFS